MALMQRGLCLILLLWMTGSRPVAGVRKESPHSSAYWNQASLELQKRAIQRRNAGDYVGAARLYQQGFEESERRNDSVAAVKFLMSVGACQLLDFHYREAVASFLQARGIAIPIDDREDAGAIAVNLANVYQQLWDFPSARSAAEEGLSIAPPNSYYMPQLFLTMGRLQAESPEPGESGATYFAKAIEAARAAGNPVVEALAWDLLGELRLNNGQHAQAEHDLDEAYRLRVFNRPSDLGFSYGLLGALRLTSGDLKSAERYTLLAMDAAARGAPAWPMYRLRRQRGEIRLAMGRVEQALEDFSSAVDAVGAWRAEIVPARSSLIGANIGLEQKMFRSFIRTAADYAYETNSAKWAAKAFEAAETNRAASLRESLALVEIWQQKLPPEYWEILARLGAERARGAIGTDSTSPSTRRLALELTEMEARAGIRNTFNKGENFRIQTSLNHFQNGLGVSDLFLSFVLGDKASYVWAVSRESSRLFRIASEREIATQVREFREAVRKNAPDPTERGQRLYRLLFEQLSAREREKRAWLLSLEGELFELPFAALVVERHATKLAIRGERRTDPVYLVERHSLQIVPGASFLNAGRLNPGRRNGSSGSPTGAGGKVLVAVGDPIYNTADSRWRGSVTETNGADTTERSGWFARMPWSARASAALSQMSLRVPNQLARLVGSAGELETVARSWRAESGTAVVLEGTDARRDSFRTLLKMQPAVIHLATHVLGSNAPETAQRNDLGSEQGFIAFGLGAPAAGAAPAAEYLSTTEIGGLRVPGALVVMTGCDTGAGDAVPGAGLLGLSRAWLMAGASGVMATSWSMEDSDGEMFSRFYQYLPRVGAAEALRRSQLRMIHSGTLRGRPSNWASYVLMGGGG